MEDRQKDEHISIHALREEGDSSGTSPKTMMVYFYPRPPRGGRRQAIPSRSPPIKISIHALREEGDLTQRIFPVSSLNFYPRPPRGGRPGRGQVQYNRPEFLSTPSARRATTSASVSITIRWYFYPRPPRGGRPPIGSPPAFLCRNFYPRPPRGGRRAWDAGGHDRPQISIHALREEGDLWFPAAAAHTDHFYPRPPRGGRPWASSGTSSCWIISIHALREEGDAGAVPCSMPYTYFYPRPPRGGRQTRS